MRPSSVTSPSVSRPFAPCPALLGSGGPVHFPATGHAALPALRHYFGLVCHLAAASRTHFGLPYRIRYRRPHAAGPCEASPGQTQGPAAWGRTLRGFPGSDARQIWSRAVERLTRGSLAG